MTKAARYAVTYGLSGLYMPDSHLGVHEFHTRRELADFIRSEIETFEFPKKTFGQARIEKRWRFIQRNGSSVAHFSIQHGPNEIAFHGLTLEEYRQQAEEEDA